MHRWQMLTKQRPRLHDAGRRERQCPHPDKKIAYTVKVENGTSDKQSYYAGDTATVTANYPASGREFNTWEAVSGNVSFADSSRWKTTFTMPATDVSLRATYKDGPSPNDNQILDLKEGAEYYIGDTIKFTASGAGMSNSNPNPGDYRYRPSAYQISNVSGVLQLVRIRSPWRSKRLENIR